MHDAPSIPPCMKVMCVNAMSNQYRAITQLQSKGSNTTATVAKTELVEVVFSPSLYVPKSFSSQDTYHPLPIGRYLQESAHAVYQKRGSVLVVLVIILA